MKDPEEVLAFKAVNSDYGSIYARAKKLSRQYLAGTRHMTDPRLPMYVARVLHANSWSDVRVGAAWNKMMLVKFPKNKLTNLTPYYANVGSECYFFSNLDSFLLVCDYQKEHYGTNELEVLEEVSLSGPPAITMEYFEDKYKLKSFERDANLDSDI